MLETARMRRRRLLLAAALPIAMLAASATARADEFYAVTGDDRLVTFNATDRTLRSPLQLTGLAASEHVAALDVRPATGGLYGVAVKATQMRFVRIDQRTGALTGVATVNLDNSPGGAGMDFNASTDQATVITTGNQAVRFNPESPVVTPLSGPASGHVSALAFAPPGGGLTGAVAINYDTDVLGFGDGTDGNFVAIGSLGVNVGENTSLDFAADGTLWMYAYTNAPRLFRVNLDGSADDLGVIGEVVLRAFCVRLTGGAAFAAPTFGAGEGDGTATVVLDRDAPADGAAKVDWATVDDSAKAGEDYTAASGTITFARNQTTATVTIPLLQDGAAEPAERIGLRLTSVDGVAAGPDAAVLIADDDQPTAPAPTPTPTPSPAPGGDGTTGPDATAPVILALPLTLRPARSLRLPFAVSEAGTATVTLSLSAPDARRLKLKRVLGTVTLTTVAGDNRATFRLAAKTVKALRRRKRIVATGEIAARDAAGNAATRTLKVTLRR